MFISSTAIDLTEHRKKVEDAILRLEQLPVAMETFGAKPDDSVETCRRLAAEADALVVVVAHRYGWIPRSEDGGDGEKSITWLEVEAALARGRAVFVFLVDTNAEWNQPKEQDRLVGATPDEALEVYAAVQGLVRFKTFLQTRIRDTFSSPDSLQAKVALSLAPWLANQVQPDDAPGASAPAAVLAGGPAREWEPRVIHPLQPAPHFAGRTVQLQGLKDWWDEPAPVGRVVSLVAAGGTGKTALAERALRYFEEHRRAGGLFVWSFYEDQKTEAFLRAACEYFVGGSQDMVGGWLERLQVALADGKPHLLVLDGLERVQSEGGSGRIRGELDEHSLKLLLQSIARGLKQVRALVTTRFDLVDLHSWINGGYHRVMLDDLDIPAARAVLRAWKVDGDDDTLDSLAERVGRHALSVSVLGSYLGTYWGGRPDHAPDFDLAEAQDTDKTASRLARVLQEYAKKLSDRERDLLARLSTFSRGVDISLLRSLAEAGGPVAGSLTGCYEGCLRLVLGKLKQQGLVFAYNRLDSETYSAHPFLRDYFHNLLTVRPQEVHEVIRASLSPSLASRPRSLPTTPALLDRYDTLIEHTRLAGHTSEALRLYRSALGEYGHLGLTVGDYDRGSRIQTGFMADRQAFNALSAVEQSFVVYERGLYVSDLGELAHGERFIEDAAQRDREQNNLGYLCVDLRHLASVRWKGGHLRNALSAASESVQAAREHGSADRLSMSHYHLGYVEFLMGDCGEAESQFQSARQPQGMRNTPTGFAHARSGYLEFEYRIRTGDKTVTDLELEAAIDNCQSRNLLREIPRYRLLLCQLALNGDDLRTARAALADVRSWTARTHDVEVTLRAYRLAAAIAVRDRHLAAAQAETDAGLQIAESSGFVLAAIDLLLHEATMHLDVPDVPAALAVAGRAHGLAESSGYAWGEADALHLLGMANRMSGDAGSARAPLEQAAAIRGRIRHPGFVATATALASL